MGNGSVGTEGAARRWAIWRISSAAPLMPARIASSSPALTSVTLTLVG